LKGFRLLWPLVPLSLLQPAELEICSSSPVPNDCTDTFTHTPLEKKKSFAWKKFTWIRLEWKHNKSTIQKTVLKRRNHFLVI